jgi:hypothetical protein
MEAVSVLVGTVESSVDGFDLGLVVGPVVLLGIVSLPVVDSKMIELVWLVPVAEVCGSTSEVPLLRLEKSTILLVLEERVTTLGAPLVLPEVNAVKLRLLPLSLIELLDGWREESDVVASDGFAESTLLVPGPLVLGLLVLVDDIELELLSAEFKLAAGVSEREAVLRRTAELLPRRVSLPVILTFREMLEEVEVVAVWSEFPVSCKDPLEITEVGMVAEIEDAGGVEESGIGVLARAPLEPEEGVATAVVFRPVPGGCLSRDEEVELFPGLVPTPAVSLLGKAPGRDVSPEPLWVESLEVASLSLTLVVFCTFVEWVPWL